MLATMGLMLHLRHHTQSFTHSNCSFFLSSLHQTTDTTYLRENNYNSVFCTYFSVQILAYYSFPFLFPFEATYVYRVLFSMPFRDLYSIVAYKRVSTRYLYPVADGYTVVSRTKYSPRLRYFRRNRFYSNA